MLEIEATREEAIKSIPDSKSIADSAVTVSRQGNDGDHDDNAASNESSKEHERNKEVNTGDNRHDNLNSDNTMPEWSDNLALRMILSLSIDETKS